MRKMFLFMLMSCAFATTALANSEVVSSTYDAEKENQLIAEKIQAAVDSIIANPGDKESIDFYKKHNFPKTKMDWVSLSYENGVLRVYGSGNVSLHDKKLITSYSNVIKAIVFEEGITGIFSVDYLPELEYVYLPSTLKTLVRSAFYSDKKLKLVNLPIGIKDISYYTFAYCESLKTIALHDSIKTIYAKAFNGCKSLEKIYIPKDITVFPDGMFRGCKSLTEINIHEGVTSIGEEAFKDCQSITSIKMPNTVTEIGEGAFRNMTSLKEVTISENITEIPEDAFKNCDLLVSVVLPESVNTLGQDSFKDCDNLESIEFKTPNLLSIAKFSFEHCKKMHTMIVHSNVAPKINKIFESENDSKEYYKKVKLYVKPEVFFTFIETPNWNKFIDIRKIEE